MFLLFSLIIIVLSGCSTNPQTPADNFDNEFTSGVNGTITNISFDNNSNVTSFLVEGEQEDTDEGYYYDKAHVSITEVTKIYSEKSDKEIPTNELKEGMNVEVVFYGPVAESYPVQAKAKIIRVTENK